MAQMTVLKAILLALYYWVGASHIGYAMTYHKPVMIGMITGIVLGDMTTGIKLGAIIQPMFLAFTAAGGTVVWSAAAGTMTGTAVVMTTGLPLEQAVTVAVPISLLFAQSGTLRKIWQAYPASLADKAALKGEDRKITFYGGWFCFLSKFVLYFLPMFIFLNFGSEVIGNVMANFPDWLKNGMSAVGGMLPAIGMGMTIRVIGRREFLPFFLGGYFLVEYTAISGLFLVFVGGFVAFMYYLTITSNQNDEDEDLSNAGELALDENTERLLDKKDLNRMMLRWLWFCEQSNSYARLQSLSFCIAFIPILKKLYGNDPEEYSAALTRHLMFFNTQGIFGAVIHGIVAAMEEQRALGAPIDPTSITSIKVGLMGPFAGIGDTLCGATFTPLLIILFLPLCAAGNPLGPLAIVIIHPLVLWSLGFMMARTGYRLGTRAAMTILSGSKIKTVISVASALGLFMLGGMSAKMVKATTPIYIPTSGSPVLIQDNILDALAPGLLPLALVLGVYRYLLKGGNVMKAVLWLTGLGIVAGSIGLIGKGGLIFQAAPAA